MGKSPTTIITYVILLCAGILSAQDIYVYPNKRLADQGLIEYRRYTLEEARAHQQGGSFEAYLTTGWSNELQLTQNQQPYWPQVVASGDSIFCSYHSLDNGQAYFISSNDGGQNWSECQFIGDTSVVRFDLFPSLAYYNGQILIGFRGQSSPGEDLFYRISPDAGVTWGSYHRIFSYWQNSFTLYSSIANSGPKVYFAYVEYIHDSLYVCRSNNWGQSWNGRGTPVAYLNSTPQCMTAKASGNDVHVVWINENGPVSVRYSRSTNNGQTWSPEIDISQDSMGAQIGFVAVQDSHVVVNWMGYKNSPHALTGDLYIRQSFDNGTSRDTTQMVSDSHYVRMGSNYIRDSLIAVTWQDARYGSWNDEITVRYSTNYGITWSDETRISYGDYFSDSPIASSTGNIIHILWGDRREANPGLYYSFNDLYDSIDDESIPIQYSQLTTYPNPFNSSVMLKYPKNEGGEIEIYDLLGQQVKTISVSEMGGQVVWDGTDDRRMSVPSGVYFARLCAPGIGIGAKLLLIK